MPLSPTFFLPCAGMLRSWPAWWRGARCRRRRPKWAPFPADLHPALVRSLQERGIAQLYSHQAEAVAHALAGRSVAVVTPTASGKTLCYNLPVLHTLLTDPQARALYLFPTKALAQDQLAELRRWSTALQARLPGAPSIHNPESTILPPPPTTATLPHPTGPGSARRRAWCSPIRTCCTWASCPITRNGRSSWPGCAGW